MSGPARTQETAADASSLIHWAYSATFGTGVYSVGDQEVLVFRAPISWTWREPENGLPESRRLGVKFLFPVTFGVQDFDFSSINQGQLPDRLKQISLLPCAQIDIPVTLRWALRAAGHLGWGRELDDDDESAWIYAADIRSRFEFMHRDSTSLNLLNGFLWSGY